MLIGYRDHEAIEPARGKLAAPGGKPGFVGGCGGACGRESVCHAANIRQPCGFGE